MRFKSLEFPLEPQHAVAGVPRDALKPPHDLPGARNNSVGLRDSKLLGFVTDSWDSRHTPLDPIICV